MKPPSVARFIIRWFTARCTGKVGANSRPVRNTPKPTRKPARHLKNLPEFVQEQVIAQAARADQGLPVRVMFQDEARFGRISNPRRCWAPPGVRPEVSAQVVREYEYAFAAVSPHDGTLDTLVLPAVHAEAMSVFLAEVSRRHPGELILMVLDGAGWHKAKRLQVPTTMRLVFLPPWSPQLNPVEHVWDEVREKWFGNRVFGSMDAVEEQLITALKILEEDSTRVASLTGFEWIRTIPLNAH